jgi:hypothetical protein
MATTPYKQTFSLIDPYFLQKITNSSKTNPVRHRKSFKYGSKTPSLFVCHGISFDPLQFWCRSSSGSSSQYNSVTSPVISQQ